MADEKDVSLVGILFVIVAHLCALPGVSSKICAPINYNIEVLTKQAYWHFELHESVPGCKEFNSSGPLGNVTSKCLFYFSICHTVPRYCPENSGICLASETHFPPPYNQTLYSEFKNIGSFNDEFGSEANYFTLQFRRGEVIPPTFSPMTLLKFQCNKSATWKKAVEGKVPYQPSVNYTQTGEYTIVFDYDGACRHGGGGGGGGGGQGPSDVLSVGSILLIVFFPGIFLYCLIGAMINHGTGKRGKEMIPHSKFWSGLPGLIADGFSFTIAKITCSEMSTTQESYDKM